MFTIESLLFVLDGSAADQVVIGATTDDVAVAIASRSYVIEVFDRAVGLDFECLSPGRTGYEVTYAVEDLGDIGPLVAATGLGGITANVIVTGELGCTG